MAAVLNDKGKEYLLSVLVAGGYAENLTFHLFTNNRKPKKTDKKSNYKEPISGGYNPYISIDLFWDKKRESISIKNIFVFTGKVGKIYGYFATVENNTLLWVERFTDGPYKVKIAGDKITIDTNVSIK